MNRLINEMLIRVLSLLLLSPRGQGHPQGDSAPYFGPSQKLDFELEMVSIRCLSYVNLFWNDSVDVIWC